eukprot:scaffold14652_cov30-Prasinocladus_malaysianus.AAC.2
MSEAKSYYSTDDNRSFNLCSLYCTLPLWSEGSKTCMIYTWRGPTMQVEDFQPPAKDPRGLAWPGSSQPAWADGSGKALTARVTDRIACRKNGLNTSRL